MAATRTAEALLRALKDTLAIRYPTTNNSVIAYESVGNDVFLTFQISTGNDSVKAIIKVMPQAVLAAQTDSLGLAQRVVRPHVAKVIFNNNAEIVQLDSTATGAGAGHRAVILAEMFRWGTKVEWHEKDDNVLDVIDTDGTTNLVASWEPLPGRDIDCI